MFKFCCLMNVFPNWWLAIVACNIIIRVSGLSVIITGPMPVNTTLNSTANFSCTVQTNDILYGVNWLVDGGLNHPGSQKELLPVNSNTKLATFKLPALHSYNDSNISCVASVGSKNFHSEKVKLLIQGILDSPMWSNDVRFIDDALSLEWNQPHTLQNVKINEYHIVVRVNNTIVESRHVDNMTNSLIVKELFGQQLLCTNVEAHVSALNDVGTSEANILDLFYPGVPVVSEINTTIEYSEGSNIVLQLVTKVDFVCTRESPNWSTDLTVQSVLDSTKYAITDNITANNITRSYQVENVTPNNLYQLDLMIHYDDGMAVVSNVTQISTFDTQDVEIGKSTAGSLCIRCHFLMSTQSKGCLLHVATQFINNNPVVTVSLTSNYLSDGLSDWVCKMDTFNNTVQSYRITVFDMEFDQTTTKVLNIDETVNGHEFGSLPLVLDDIVITTTTYSTSASQSAHSDSRTAVTSITKSGENSNYSYTTTNSAFPVTDSPVPSVQQQAASNDSAIIVIIAVCFAVSALLVCGIIAVLVVLIFTRYRKTKRSHSNIIMSSNAVYAVNTSSLKISDEMHIYSEISQNYITPQLAVTKTDNESGTTEKQCKTNDEALPQKNKEWVSNPTYGSSIAAPEEGLKESSVNGNNIHRSDNTFLTAVCPAYSSMPLDKEKHIYEDLNKLK